jgi:hypothetical protein
VTLDLFDNVRIRRTPLTEELGVADCIGQVYGDTTPSVTGVNVIGGGDGEDRAFNVVIPGKPADLWFAPALLELVDHAPGTEMRVGDKRLVRLATGEWVEVS